MSRTVVSRRDTQPSLDASKVRVEKAFERLGPIVVVPGETVRVPAAVSVDLPADVHPDTYLTRLMKYLPGEVVALYIALDAILRSVQQTSVALHWTVFVLCVAATYWYLWRVAKVSKQTQLAISVAAFCVWVFALGGPFEYLAWYEPHHGALLLPVYTFFIATIEA